MIKPELDKVKVNQAVDNIAQKIAQRDAWLRIFIFLLLLGLVWLPVAIAVYWPESRFYGSNTANITSLALLYVGFLVGLPTWGRRVHGWTKPFQRCGLRLQGQFGRDLGVAFAIGTATVCALFELETLLGWARPTMPHPQIGWQVLEGLLMALAVGFAEELLFRGWVLAELEKNYRSTAALVMNAAFFAATHFIKAWSEIVRTLPQVAGLVLLGVVLVWARRSPTGYPGKQQTRLGYPIGLHAGLIWGYYIFSVGELIEYTGRVPDWVTGIDGNPLAGLLGLVGLSLVGYQFARIARTKTA